MGLVLRAVDSWLSRSKRRVRHCWGSGCRITLASKGLNAQLVAGRSIVTRGSHVYASFGRLHDAHCTMIQSFLATFLRAKCAAALQQRRTPLFLQVCIGTLFGKPRLELRAAMQWKNRAWVTSPREWLSSGSTCTCVAMYLCLSCAIYPRSVTAGTLHMWCDLLMRVLSYAGPHVHSSGLSPCSACTCGPTLVVRVVRSANISLWGGAFFQ